MDIPNPTSENLSELIARIKSNERRSLENLLPFLNIGIQRKHVCDISGPCNSGKTILLMEIIASTILPIEYGGRNAHVILLDNDHKFAANVLNKIIGRQILNFMHPIEMDQQTIDNVTYCALEHLHVIKSYDAFEYDLAIMELDLIITSNVNVALIAIDSLLAFYWAQYPNSMRYYYEQLFQRLMQMVDKHYVALLFTRSDYFKVNDARRIDHFIQLTNVNGKFKANITKYKNNSIHTLNYEINDIGIKMIAST